MPPVYFRRLVFGRGHVIGCHALGLCTCRLPSMNSGSHVSMSCVRRFDLSDVKRAAQLYFWVGFSPKPSNPTPNRPYRGYETHV